MGKMIGIDLMLIGFKRLIGRRFDSRERDVDPLAAEGRARESEDKSKQEEELIIRLIEGLVTNTVRAVQVLEGKLTPDERHRILDSIERAKQTRSDGSIDELKARLTDLENAAGIIGTAMLRP